MSKKLRETKRVLFKLDKKRKNNMDAIRDLEQTKGGLLSFAAYAKDVQPENPGYFDTKYCRTNLYR